MNSIIQPNYGMGTYKELLKSREMKQSGTQTGSFLDMVAQTAKDRSDALPSGMNGIIGTAAISANLMMNPAIQTAEPTQTNGIESAETPTLETMLKAKYPNLVYHTFDASSSYWRTRNDYPHYLLYQSGDKAAETLENWQPDGPNPFYGSIDGRFTAPKEIHALGNVPPGSKAVVIHPKVQERMEQDPEYAKEIMAKIDTWFAFDVARNEAIMPGSTIGMSQAVAIGEDGNICNAVSSSCGGEITHSSDEVVQAYYLRMAKRADFMRWLAKKQLADKIQENQQISDLNASAAAKFHLSEMMRSGNLQKIFGSEIAGIPTETVLAITQAQIWGTGVMMG